MSNCFFFPCRKDSWPQPHLKMAANAGFAIPLCLPNNCQWNKQTGEVSRSSEQRNSLYVVDEALDQLRKIKGMSVSDQINGLQKPKYHKSMVNGTSWANHSVSRSLQQSLLDIGNRGYSVGYIVMAKRFSLRGSACFLQFLLILLIYTFKGDVYSRCPVTFDFWIGEWGLTFDTDKIYL